MRPRGIESNTAGSVLKMRPGPPVGSMPKLNTAGMMAMPESSAMSVSSPTTVQVSLVMLVSFFK